MPASWVFFLFLEPPRSFHFTTRCLHPGDGTCSKQELSWGLPSLGEEAETPKPLQETHDGASTSHRAHTRWDPTARALGAIPRPPLSSPHFFLARWLSVRKQKEGSLQVKTQTQQGRAGAG